MKKIISLQVCMLMSLAVGSTFMVDAYGNTNKYAKGKPAHQSMQDDEKKAMKDIEKDLHMIKSEFNKDHNALKANKELDKMPARIKKAISEMKAHEKAGKMWKTHESTLNRKVKGLREYIKHHTQLKNKNNKKK